MTFQGDNFAESIMENGVTALSKSKTVEWTGSGDLVISRRKIKLDGSLESNAYEIYIDPKSCREMIKKFDEIQRTMTEVKYGRLANPTNVFLDAPRIVQVSLYNGRPKFGIHKLDEGGRITRCMGLNFTPVEYNELMKFFSQYPPPPEENENQLLGEAKFSVTGYGFKWIPDPVFSQTGALPTSDNICYLSPEECFLAAESKKPLGFSSVEISTTQELYGINSDFVDAAVAKIIIQNIETQKTLEIMQSKPCAGGGETLDADIAVYGPRIREDIYLVDIFRLCLKVISLSEKPSAFNISNLMAMVLERGNHPDALESLTNNTLNQQYVDLFQQIFV